MFTHLHVHTEYSLLDGLSRVHPLVQRCKELGMASLAITDHGAMYGVVEFYSECKQAGVKPILGCELYVATGDRRSRTPADKSPYHLTVLAKDERGYRNLIQLVTRAHIEGFYYRPRVDKELLARHHQGLIILSGCLNAEIPRLLLEGRSAEAHSAVGWYREVFGPDFYLELQEHPGVEELQMVNRGLLDLNHKLDLPIVATNDPHYVYQQESPLQDILICIHTGTTINDDKRLKMAGDSFYLKSAHEMTSLFAELPQALANTEAIAEQCQVELDFSHLHLPEFPLPQDTDCDSSLAQLCREGLRRRVPKAPTEYQQRLSYELEVIKQTRFANYFLVVWDIATFARQQGILMGVRGSAAASLALYCLDVTDVDPLEYRLVFERFLNLERKEMPDIDMDFQDDRRGEVINYVAQKYGRDRVAQIITFGTLGPKAAIRDVGRALGMPYADVDRVARLVPFRAHSLEEATAMNPELKMLQEADPTLARLMETAQRLEGTVRHVSTHAAGVVISKEPLTDYVPLQPPIRAEAGETSMTQYPMEPIAKLGLLKMDFLGLSNMTILKRAIELLEQTRGIKLDLHKLPLDNEKTFQLLSSGETTDVFQLEGAGMRRYIQALKPTSLGDIAAMIALYRPGPMEHIETYIKAKHGQEPVHYPHPSLERILEETNGVIVYQDQVLFIVQAVAGYSLGEADVVRKAMGKKNPEIMQRERERFLQGAQRKGFTPEEATAIFNLIEPFAGYAFNKAHSVSYALVAYWTAYFKANYPVEYMSSVLNARLGNQEKVASATAECHRMGIPVLRPDVSKSGLHFTIEAQPDGRPGVRFGLAAVKNVGEAAVLPVIRAREEAGPFTSLEDFCHRVDLRQVNRRALESLIKVGALDDLANRGALLASVGRILSLAQRQARLKETGQATMFDLFGQEVATPLGFIELTPGAVQPREKLAWEKELLGVALSENPFSAMVASLAGSEAIISVQDIDPEMAGQKIVVAGQVSSVRQSFTRERRPFISAALALMDGSIEVTAWPNVYESTKDLWEEGSLLWIVGKVRLRDDRLSVVCDEVKPYHPPPPAVATENGLAPASSRTLTAIAAGPCRLWLAIRESDDPVADELRLRDAIQLLREHPGAVPVYLEILSGERKTSLQVQSVTVQYTPELHRLLEGLLGQGTVWVTSGNGEKNS